MPSPAALFVWGLHLLAATTEAYELYNDTGGAPTAIATAADGSYTGLAAYDPTQLQVPALPENVIKEAAINIPISPATAAMGGYQASIPQKGNFLGFSIELSVAANVLGTNGQLIKPTFLNYLENIRVRARAGPVLRVGGNTQEGSTLFVDGLEGESRPTEKFKSDIDTPTATPVINYSINLFYLMANISSLVEAEWFFGLSFNETSVKTHSENIPLAAHHAQTILGDNLRGLAMGNEPDLYAIHTKRGSNYTINDYRGEFSEMRQFVEAEGNLPRKLDLAAPSICCNTPGFDTYDMMNSGWFEENLDYLKTFTVQHYPNNNCKINGREVNVQEIFSGTYLTHQSPMDLTWPYIEYANKVVSAGKEMVMLEFNTASCGGFPGLSDSFGGALWVADWALQLAWGNFSNALMHVGGQNVYYNAFTPPPWTSAKAGWTTGSVYYSALVVAEALGSSNTSQVVDYFRLSDQQKPSYLIYENGAPARVVLFNYLSDASGAADYTATIGIDGMALDHVYVRYFLAPTIADQYNITWANQSMGASYTGDGRLRGDLSTVRVGCTDGKCLVNVPGPSLALVFLTDAALDEVIVPDDEEYFTTSMIDVNGVAVDKSLVDSGNGMNPDWNMVYGSGQPQVEIGLALVSAAIVFTLVLGW